MNKDPRAWFLVPIAFAIAIIIAIPAYRATATIQRNKEPIELRDTTKQPVDTLDEREAQHIERWHLVLGWMKEQEKLNDAHRAILESLLESANLALEHIIETERMIPVDLVTSMTIGCYVDATTSSTGLKQRIVPLPERIKEMLAPEMPTPVRDDTVTSTTIGPKYALAITPGIQKVLYTIAPDGTVKFNPASDEDLWAAIQEIHESLHEEMPARNDAIRFCQSCRNMYWEKEGCTLCTRDKEQ